MKKLLLMSVLFLSIAQNFAVASSGNWQVRKIKEVLVLESWPVQYQVKFMQACYENEVKVIKFVQGGEVVLGVAVKQPVRGAMVCLAMPSERSKTIMGETTDPSIIKTLN
jgi:hypothetical protein